MRPLWQTVSGLGLGQIIGWGTTYYALGALSPEIARETGWSPTLIFGAFSASLLLSSLISRSCGRIVDLWGGRRAMVLGSVLCAAGCLLLGLASNPVIYVIGWLVLAPAMRLATYDAAFASLAQLAGARARISISYLSLFGGLASTVFWPLGHALGSSIGWQGTFLVYALLHLCVCLPIHALMLGGKTGQAEVAPASTATHLQGRDRTIAMVVFSCVLALNGLVFAAISAHVIPLFTGLGLAGAQAVTLAALIGPSQVTSRILEILVGRYWSPSVLAMIAFGLLPVSLAIAWGGSYALVSLTIFVLLYGASNGLVTIAKGTYPLALLGTTNYGQTLGTITAPSLVLNALSPLAMAWVLEQSGPASAMHLGLAAGLLSGFGMLWLLRRFPTHR